MLLASLLEILQSQLFLAQGDMNHSKIVCRNVVVLCVLFEALKQLTASLGHSRASRGLGLLGKLDQGTRRPCALRSRDSLGLLAHLRVGPGQPEMHTGVVRIQQLRFARRLDGLFILPGVIEFARDLYVCYRGEGVKITPLRPGTRTELNLKMHSVPSLR
jgi:hypothetical protein